ncbi:glycosyl hydrolase 115 family protein [Echinicola marina]|uniref:glycosyl hydrolase 115 family protein n=1 Tax=Echinicola marina TaxID=2859768 RepID=UPI001CF70DB8|nr:glycosyl hydrolase 115 family protein [Echinicola marina]UCS93331.1 glycosyl hydrolase 115 family protein [Echinicola marina]
MSSLEAQQLEKIVSFEPDDKGFSLVGTNGSSAILLEEEADGGVKVAVENFLSDIQEVTGVTPELLDRPLDSQSSRMVIIGTIGESNLINDLIENRKLEVSDVGGKWESFLIQTVPKPFPGVEEALVIAGSDKRGTIFGIYEMSEQIGVSPWSWWADVPVKKSGSLYIKKGRYSLGSPAVKYRGIFINDEAPALSGWAHEKFGGFNHKFYEKVYELILRLKGNFLWPAMWGRSLYEDDPLNPVLADKYGVVIGTSHHEPLMRAHVDWAKHGEGEWDYTKNDEKLRQFWRKGMERMGSHESLVTIGMRGDGDEAMSEESNVALLEKIVNDQREIIAEVTGKPAHETPQVWALYKEVQEYYDKGMRVPDDVTLLLCDDNWGNVRKLPKIGEKQHSGGYGMYYHFDYVGGPRNYKWLNTNSIPRIWEQMHLTYEHGVDEIWIVNVGDIKPMELPTSFFLDYAWDPNALPAERLPEYTRRWAAQQFGERFKVEIAEILDLYTKYNARRTPEMLDQNTYSLNHYQEAERVVADYKVLAQEAQAIYDRLEAQYKPAYYQLVLFPVLACSNLHELYLSSAKNRLYAQQGRAVTNDMAKKVEELFAYDAELTSYYNEELLDGKWNHMMDQNHIGYTYWQEPKSNVMPEVKRIELPETGSLGVAISNADAFYPQATELVLEEMSPFQTYDQHIVLFNRGKSPIQFDIQKKPKWLVLDKSSGGLDKQEKLTIKVDWEKLPYGKTEGELTIRSGKEKVKIQVPVNRLELPENFTGFVESNGYVSMEADHFTSKEEIRPVSWQIIPGLGKTGSAITAFPVAYETEDTGALKHHVSFDAYFTSSGEITIHTYLSPTLNFKNTEEGLRFGISVDDEAPQIISMHKEERPGSWDKWVGEHINIKSSQHLINRPGKHQIKLWLVDPGVVFQKIVVDTGGLKGSYLGPEESFFKVTNK